MSVYLAEHKPALSQYRSARRPSSFPKLVTGAIVMHTAESPPDVVGDDLGAENVARWIATRTDTSASYHSVVDADSIVHVCEYGWEAFHEGTGGNRWSLGLSIATRAELWARLDLGWVTRAIEQAALEAANMAAWVKSNYGIDIPAVHINAADYRAGKPGFVGHGELDPGRRSDPGADFPWGRFLSRFAELRADQTVSGEEMPEPIPVYSLMDLSRVMAQVDELYVIYRGDDTGSHVNDLREWGKDIAAKLAVGEDPIPTLNYVQWALAKE